jgi:methyl coenzyme M reductase subunit D
MMMMKMKMMMMIMMMVMMMMMHGQSISAECGASPVRGKSECHAVRRFLP